MAIGTPQKLIAAFVALILGVVLLAQIALQTNDVTSKELANNESVSIAPARLAAGTINETYTFTLANPVTGFKADTSDCDISGFIYKNQTGGTLTETTDYVVNTEAGTFTLKNTVRLNNTAAGNNTAATYSFCPNDYLTQAWSRSALNLVGGFFAIGLLLLAVGLFFSIAKENGFA